MNATQLYSEVENVVVDTFSLWDVKRVGFSWRKYYLDHTLQVQSLALRMAAELDADPEQLRHAAILHDVTKRYDGAVVKDAAGANVLDNEGFWLNETIRPDRANWVTRLYGDLGLDGQIHHVSGATLTEHILREHGLPENFIRPVAKIVRGHLRGKVTPTEHDERYREIEVRILYDADTIDPNVGMAAFYRNIQINAGFAMERGEPMDVAAYVERLPRWIDTKDIYRDRMLTDLGREICDIRYARVKGVLAELQSELSDQSVNRRYGMLGVLEHLLTNPEDPSIREHLAALRSDWLPSRERALAAENELDRDAAAQALNRARRFTTLIETEVAGG